MAVVDHQALARRYAAALAGDDLTALDEVFTEDVTDVYPQSGEVIRGRDRLRAILEHRPGSPSFDASTVQALAGDGRQVVSPLFTVVRCEGRGDAGTATLRVRYPDGSWWWLVVVYELREGRIARSTTFFAPEFEAPAWRAAFVERKAQPAAEEPAAEAPGEPSPGDLPPWPSRPTGTPAALPTGTLTFLFSDIEGSTRLAERLGPAFRLVLERHHALLRGAFTAAGGVEVSTEGDAFFVVFRSAPAAVAGAAAAQRALANEPWPEETQTVHVRMGLHTGEGILGGDDYVGLDVNRAARIAAAAHGGQVLVSEATQALADGSLPADLRFRDLGAFRLKDFDRPQHLVQLVVDGLADEFPPPRTLDTPSNLPLQPTTFIGRDDEVVVAAQLVRRARLVTLTGPGGTGKTRLSLRVAEESTAEFPGGAFFVDLSPLADPGLIPATIAQAVGVREEATRPITESLESYLRDRRLLLVLDNLEQLLDGAPIVRRLLDAAPGLTIVATSREPLHLRGEQEFPVPPLALPDLAHLPPLEDVARYDAIALFVARAQAARPDFRLDEENAAAVAAICARLDGLPLAIELAAARVKLLAPEAILGRLGSRLTLLTSGARDLPERQRTLRGAIGWSYDLLSPGEQALLRRLAVFLGSFTLDAAVAVGDPDGDLVGDMLEALGSLADKSLLRVGEAPDGEPRFSMLESIRAYGLERLADESEAPPVRERHLAYFARLALAAEPELMGGHPKPWLDRLEIEQDNIRAALEVAGEGDRAEDALRMAGALWRFWQERGHLAEGREVLARLLARPGSGRPTAARAKALGALGGVAYWQGDFGAAKEAYAEALAIQRGLDDPSGLAEALYNAGFVASVLGDQADAQADYEESAAIFERIEDRQGLVRVREASVFRMLREGELAAARALQEENVLAFRQSGQRIRAANGLNLLAAIRTRAGAFREARAALADAGPIFREAGDMQGLVRLLILAAASAVGEGDPSRAARLSGLSDLLREPLGDIATPLQLLRIADPAVTARTALGDEAYEAAYREGRDMPLDEAIASLDG